jgi:hypothetical protein
MSFDHSNDWHAPLLLPDKRPSAVAAGEWNMLAADGCDCVICTLDGLRKKDFDYQRRAPGLASGPLELNLIGLRRFDSVSDRFDDRMVVAFKMLPPEQKERFEGGIGGDALDMLKRAAGDKKAKLKHVDCRRRGGKWVAAIFEISTDPGLTGTAKQDALKAYDGFTQAIALKDKALETTKTAIKAARADIEHKEKAREAATGKANKDLKKEIRQLKRMLGEPKLGKKAQKKTLIGQADKLERERAGLEAKAKEAKAKADASAFAKSKHQTTIKQGPNKGETKAIDRGGLHNGRAWMAPGRYEGVYRLGTHKGVRKDPKKFKPKGLAGCHIALRIGETNGLRLFNGAFLKSKPVNWMKNQPKEFRHDSAGNAVVARYFPDGQAPKRYRGSEALLVSAGSGDVHTLEIVHDGRRTPVSDDDVVAVRATIQGTNIHRAHTSRYDDAQGKLVGSKRVGSWVGNWSEGCQVYRRIEQFNVFILLVSVVKRWQCIVKHHQQVEAPSCDLLQIGTGDAPGKGEQKLLSWFTKPLVDLAVSYQLHKDLVAAKSALKKKPPSKAFRNATKEKQRQDDVEAWPAKRAQLEAQVTSLQAIYDQAVIEDAIAAKQAQVAAAQSAHDKAKDRLDAVPETAKGRRGSRQKTLGKKQTQLDARKNQLETLENKRDESKDRAEELRKDRIEFLRNRSNAFRAAGYRECDVDASCGARFSYLLLEVAEPDLEDLEDQLKKCNDWNGKLVLPG